MSDVDRRRFVSGAAATILLPATASAQSFSSRKSEKIDAMANSAIHFMMENIPATREMVGQSAGFLMFPVMTRGALLFGAAFGDGVLRVGGETVDFYQATQFNAGIQLSATQYSQAVFFLNEGALSRFRQSLGWKFGAGMRFVVIEDTQTMSMDTLTHQVDVAGLTFGDSGLHVGLSIEGTKFTLVAA